MAFGRILQQLVRRTHGALGALFVDYEGETVEVVTDRPLDADVHDLRVIGAYQGIFLTRLREVADKLPIGHPKSFKIEFERTVILSCDVKDGYYLVLVIDHEAVEGVAWHRLAECRSALLAEMGY
jgi:predicted regulator of Ras-like GTPase activity (Roadblock/LC7/MglB family)